MSNLTDQKLGEIIALAKQLQWAEEEHEATNQAVQEIRARAQQRAHDHDLIRYVGQELKIPHKHVQQAIDILHPSADVLDATFTELGIRKSGNFYTTYHAKHAMALLTSIKSFLEAIDKNHKYVVRNETNISFTLLQQRVEGKYFFGGEKLRDVGALLFIHYKSTTPPTVTVSIYEPQLAQMAKEALQEYKKAAEVEGISVTFETDFHPKSLLPNEGQYKLG